MGDEARGSISFFATYRPPLPLDIYSLPLNPSSNKVECMMTDGKNYNYNGQVIPNTSLKVMLEHPNLKCEGTKEDVDEGRLTGLIFVSERTDNLETLHIALRFKDKVPKVLNFAKVYGIFDGARLEDSACFAGENGEYLIYVSTKDRAAPHQPWNAVYRTHLSTGETERLTPEGQADLSPAVSPDGTMLAVASFQDKPGGWCGEIEDLHTNIFVMDLEEGFRELVVTHGGWPTWGSDDILFFHRKTESNDKVKRWGVFRVDKEEGMSSITRVTPDDIDAVTPAAIDGTTVAVATIRMKSGFLDDRTKEQYRHIEIFDSTNSKDVIKVTLAANRLVDHFNPFVVLTNTGDKRIGYHRCGDIPKVEGESEKKSNLEKQQYFYVPRQFDKILCPHLDVGLFRVSGVFPTFSPDGKKLAFVDNQFKNVWVADDNELRIVYPMKGPDSLFSPVWNQNPEEDTLYVCFGPSFHKNDIVNICTIRNVSKRRLRRQPLTTGFNNAFPSTNKQGNKLVYRSTRDHQFSADRYKNLYIMKDVTKGDTRDNLIRLTTGNCVDTHCQWSPTNDWIVFSSNRDMPKEPAPAVDLPDLGYFAVYVANANKPDQPPIKVIDSGEDIIRRQPFAGHVNHPYFSPDGKTLVVASDLAAVSCDPISLPLYLHSVRPYGDLFSVELDTSDIEKNENLKDYGRLTHSRYENSTATWTAFSTKDTSAAWNKFLESPEEYAMTKCPYMHDGGGQSGLMSGHLGVSNPCC